LGHPYPKSWQDESVTVDSKALAFHEPDYLELCSTHKDIFLMATDQWKGSLKKGILMRTINGKRIVTS